MMESFARKLAISLLAILLTAFTACGSETGEYQASYENSSGTDNSGMIREDTWDEPAGSTSNTAVVPAFNRDLTVEEKRKWMEYFRQRMTHLLPSFKMSEGIPDADMISFSANYIVWCAKEDEGFEIEQAYYGKLGYNISRINREYVEKASRLLFGREMKAHETSGVYIYEDGSYWVLPHGYELNVLPRIVGYTENADGSLSFDIEYYYYSAEVKLHTTDGTELAGGDISEKALDDSVKFSEEPFAKKRITLGRANDDYEERYIILENVIY